MKLNCLVRLTIRNWLQIFLNHFCISTTRLKVIKVVMNLLVYHLTLTIEITMHHSKYALNKLLCGNLDALAIFASLRTSHQMDLTIQIILMYQSSCQKDLYDKQCSWKPNASYL